jgi:hypothetical protein
MAVFSIGMAALTRPPQMRLYGWMLTAKGIDSPRHDFEVVRVDAGRISKEVIRNQAFRNRSLHVLIRVAMGEHHRASSGYAYPSIPGMVTRGCPVPATSSLIYCDVGHETRGKRKLGPHFRVPPECHGTGC